MKRAVAAVLTVVAMGLLLWAGARRGAVETSSVEALRAETGATAGPVVNTPPPAHPAEARVQALLESARGGDVGPYLDAFTGDLRARIEREAAERGRAAFASDLAAAARLRKSHAVFAAEPVGTDAALVTVEAVYPDRNERQTYRVEEAGGAWRVAAVETVRTVRPKVAYGSPATFDGPEGTPVQGTGLTVETGEEVDPTTGQPTR